MIDMNTYKLIWKGTPIDVKVESGGRNRGIYTHKHVEWKKKKIMLTKNLQY